MKKAVMLFVLFAAVAAMAQTPKQSVAVYMAGTEPVAVRGAYKVLGAELAKALAKSGKYTAVDRTAEVIKVLSAAEIFGKDGAIDVDKAKRVGKQLGAQVVCVAEISEVMQSYFLEARLVNVETAEVSNVGSMYGDMISAKDVVRVSQTVAMELVGVTSITGTEDATHDVQMAMAEPVRKLVDYTFREIAANPDKVIANYTEAIKQEPSVAEYYSKRGYAYLCKEWSSGTSKMIDINSGDTIAVKTQNTPYYGMAIEDYTIAIRLDPKDASNYYHRGYLNYHRITTDERFKLLAIEDYSEVIRLAPNFIGGYFYRGVSYREIGKKIFDNVNVKYIDLAIADFDEIIRIEPNYPRAYLIRGNLYVDKKDYDRAIADYNEIIRLTPNNAEAYRVRGNMYKDKGDYDRAIADWETALRIDPKNNSYLQNKLENIRLQSGEYFTTGVMCINNINNYVDRDNDYGKAIKNFTKFIKKNPKSAMGYAGRGVAYYGNKNYKRAVADWETALKLCNYPELKYQLTRAKERIKSNEKMDIFNLMLNLDITILDDDLKWKSLNNNSMAKKDEQKKPDMTKYQKNDGGIESELSRLREEVEPRSKKQELKRQETLQRLDELERKKQELERERDKRRQEDEFEVKKQKLERKQR